MQPEGLDKLPVIAYGRSLGASLAVHAGAHARLLPMRVCGVIVESGLMEWASLPVVQVHCSIAHSPSSRVMHRSNCTTPRTVSLRSRACRIGVGGCVVAVAGGEGAQRPLAAVRATGPVGNHI